MQRKVILKYENLLIIFGIIASKLFYDMDLL